MKVISHEVKSFVFPSFASWECCVELCGALILTWVFFLPKQYAGTWYAVGKKDPEGLFLLDNIVANFNVSDDGVMQASAIGRVIILKWVVSLNWETRLSSHDTGNLSELPSVDRQNRGAVLTRVLFYLQQLGNVRSNVRHFRGHRQSGQVHDEVLGGGFLSADRKWVEEHLHLNTKWFLFYSLTNISFA